MLSEPRTTEHNWIQPVQSGSLQMWCRLKQLIWPITIGTGLQWTQAHLRTPKAPKKQGKKGCPCHPNPNWSIHNDTPYLFHIFLNDHLRAFGDCWAMVKRSDSEGAWSWFGTDCVLLSRHLEHSLHIIDKLGRDLRPDCCAIKGMSRMFQTSLVCSLNCCFSL